MNNKEYIIMGLGNFGTSVAKQLEKNGCRVLALDRNSDKVKNVADSVTYAVNADASDVDALKELGLGNFDCAIISMGKNLDATVLSVITLKEAGVKKIIVKANDPLHAKIVKKVGADQVIFPENEMGVHMANNLSMDNMFDTIELSQEYSIIDLNVPEQWIGKSLIELKCREKYGINVIGIKRHGQLTITPSASAPLAKQDVLVVIGKNDILKKLGNKL